MWEGVQVLVWRCFVGALTHRIRLALYQVVAPTAFVLQLWWSLQGSGFRVQRTGLFSWFRVQGLGSRV